MSDFREPPVPKPVTDEGLRAGRAEANQVTVGPSEAGIPRPPRAPTTTTADPSPFLAVTKAAGPAAHAEAAHSPGRRGTVAGARPWGSGRAASGFHPGSPAPRSHRCPLRHHQTGEGGMMSL